MGRNRLVIGVCLHIIVAFSPRGAFAFDLRFTHGQPSAVAGYRVFYGTESRSYEESFDFGPQGGTPGAVLTLSIPVALPAATPLYVALRAFDAAGQESAFSNEIVLLPPGARGPDDGVADDGDGSGVPGDAPCANGELQSCDDNCPFVPNGPSFGTCIRGDAARQGSPCTADADCGGSGAYCSMDQEDADGDGVGDACAGCAAGDPDCVPAQCPLATADADADGIGDVCDLCPTRKDPRQFDADQDGIGDVCDASNDVPGPVGGGSSGGTSTDGSSGGGTPPSGGSSGSSSGGTSIYDTLRAAREARLRALRERADEVRAARRQTLCERYRRCN